jgi:para-nitrobenzyl esterase
VQQANLFPGGIPETIVPGDDCLNVNIFTPSLGSARLPVIVWIHGGAYLAGGNSSPWYRGDRFASHGVVVVSINYRLGIDGFLEMEGAPSNRAVLDWLAALEWVQDNIAAFGGDPGNVTIAGQSAGGGACGILLGLPRAQGLFGRVICMSGVLEMFASRDDALLIAQRVTTHLGLGSVARRAELAEISTERLLDAQAALSSLALTSTSLALGPVIDGDLVTMAPLDAIRDGGGRQVPVAVGTTAEELHTMLGGPEAEVAPELVTALLSGLGLSDRQIDAYRAGHPALANGPLLGQALTDLIFRRGSIRLAESRSGQAGSATGGTYVYEFRWRPPELDNGACHCIDIPFAFDNLDAVDVKAIAGAEPPQGLADELHSAWIRMAATGDPGWPRYELPRRPTMIFDTPSTVLDDPLASERILWEEP